MAAFVGERVAFVWRKINIQINERFNRRMANWLIKRRHDYYDQLEQELVTDAGQIDSLLLSTRLPIGWNRKRK